MRAALSATHLVGHQLTLSAMIDGNETLTYSSMMNLSQNYQQQPLQHTMDWRYGLGFFKYTIFLYSTSRHYPFIWRSWGVFRLQMGQPCHDTRIAWR